MIINQLAEHIRHAELSAVSLASNLSAAKEYASPVELLLLRDLHEQAAELSRKIRDLQAALGSATSSDGTPPASLNDLKLARRIENNLIACGIKTVEQLLALTYGDLQRLPNMRVGDAVDVEVRLHGQGLSLSGKDRVCVANIGTVLVHQLGVTPAIEAKLANVGIVTVEQLAAKTRADLLFVPGLGATSVNEIQIALRAHVLSLKA